MRYYFKHLEWPQEFVEGVRLFNAEQFFETHELWEEIWRKAPADARDFYQGMIHLTVALYQARRGNMRAAHSQLRRATRRLARYEPSHRGLNISEFREEVAKTVGRLEAGPVHIYPKISLEEAASRESPPIASRRPPPEETRRK